MAATMDLSNILDPNEVSTLTSETKTKLNNYIQLTNKKLDDIGSKYEKLRVTSEQRNCDVEKQLSISNTKLDEEISANEKFRARVEELEKQYNEASEKLQSLEGSQEGNLSTQLRLSKANQQLEDEKREFTLLLEKRNREVDNLNEELREMSEKLSKLNTSKCEALANLDEIRGSEVTRELQIKRLDQEVANLNKQIEWLNKDVNDKTRELVVLRREKSTKLLEVQCQLEMKTEEATDLKSTLETVQSTNAEQTRKIEQYIQRIKDLQDSTAQSEEKFRQEIQARAKLADLYKAAADEAEVKCTSLTGAVTELQNLLKEAAEGQRELECQKNEEISTVREEMFQQEKKIESLEQELVNANDLLSTMKNRGASEENVEAMFPTAAVTSRLLKSGMSLTQIYNEYVKASDELELEKEENKRLNTYLDQILQEIQDKAPQLKKQKEDYELALRSIDQMTRQLDAAMLDSETLRSESDESHRKSSHLMNENKKHQQTIRDLSQQVKYLVKEVEEIRGGRVVRDEEVSSCDVSSSSNLISGRLVTFRNIDELQEQNQRLMAAIRELSEKQEQEENSTVDTRTRELREQLEAVQEELGEMREARERQVQMVESIVRQRDMYRVLLQQTNETSSPMDSFSHMRGSGSPDKSSLKSPGVDRESQKKLEEALQALKQLQSEFASYKKEKMENDKISNEQLESKRQEVSDLRVQNTKIASQLDFAAERAKVALSNSESYKKEISMLQNKLQKYTASVAKHEQQIDSQRQELLKLQEQLSQAQARAENLRSERDIIKASEQRLLAELDSMRRDRHTQTMVMANLQAIQNNLERSENDTRLRLGKQVEGLERERNLLKRRLETEEKQLQTLQKHQELRLKECTGRLEQELKAHQGTRDLLRTRDSQIADLKQQLMTVSTKLATSETQLASMADSSGGSNEARDIRAELDAARQEVDSLQNQLTKAKQHTDQYKTIADTIQQTLKEQNEASESFKESIEEKLRVAEEKSGHLEEKVDTLEKERTQLIDENVKVNQDSHTLNADLRKKLVELQNELQESNERRETAIAIEMSAKQECDEQTRRASDAQDKYERELMLHAADVEALSALKKEMEGFNAKLSAKEEQAAVAEQQLTELKASSATCQAMLKEERDKMAARVTDLMQETKALHQQMNKLSSQVISVQERAALTPRSKLAASSAPEEDKSKSSEQLLEIVRYLRKEKDISEGKLDVVETECSRLKQRCETLERQLESANQQLAEEREQSQAGLQTAAQHAELMHRVESYNLLHDSNKLLREERDQMQTKLTQAEAKLNKLEETIQPLQSEVRELQSQREATITDNRSLTAEMERWKTRTNQLIEQSHKTDPEEHKRLVQEREEIRKQLNTVTEEMRTAKAEATKNSIEVAKLQRQIGILKEENTTMSTELASIKTALDAKENDIKEKLKTINQLKMVGRKYKTQAEVAQKEMEDLKAKQTQQEEDDKGKQTQQQATAEQIQGLQQNLSSAEAKLSECEGKTQEQTQKLLQTEVQLKTVEEQKAKLEKNLIDSIEEKKRVEEQLQKAQQDAEQTVKEVTAKFESEHAAKFEAEKQELVKKDTEIQSLKEQVSSLNEQRDEVKKKLERSMSMLSTAKSKLQSMKENNDKLTAKNLELKKQVEDNTEAQSASEVDESSARAQVEALQREVSSARAQVEALQKEVRELQTKVKQYESTQKLVTPQSPGQVSRSAGPGVQDRTSFSVSQTEPPKTANIRPIASSPASIKPQTVPVQPQSAASRVTASIRPMAITPNVAVTTTCTPTATVMPTTVSQPDTSIEEEAVPPVQQLFGQQTASQQSASAPTRPTQQVQRVIPTQESQSTDAVVESNSASASASVDEVGGVEPQQTSSGSATSTGTTVAQPGKRSRDHLESPGDDSAIKRTKVSAAEPEADDIPEITVTDTSGNVDDTVAMTTTEDAGSPGGLVLGVQDEQTTQDVEETVQTFEYNDDLDELEAPTPRLWEEATMPGSVRAEDDADAADDGAVIIMSSDEGEEVSEKEGSEDQTADDEEDDEEEEEEVEDDEDDEDDEEMINYETQQFNEEDGEMEEGGVDIQADTQQQDDDDDVVIIDEDEDGEMEEGEPAPVSQSGLQSSQQSSVSPLQSLMPPARGQLAPFMIGGQSAFEDLDDCTVPSTPTLNVPRRGDGFAEAISSPQVSQSFIFGSGGEQHLTLSGLAQLENQAALGMGMDDTRVDLSQLEDGSGRSVPSTPLHTAAPVTIITEATEQPAGNQSETDVVQSEAATQEEQDEANEGDADLGEDQEEEPGLEGEQGEEDDEGDILASEADDSQQADDRDKDSQAEASGSKEDGGAFGTDRSQEYKPKIQKIVWEEPTPVQTTPTPAPSSSQPIQSISTVTSPQFRSRGGPPRGAMPSRGAPRGNFGGQRGGQARRSNRGRGMFTRRPPMY